VGKEDNWLMYGVGALILGIIAFFGLGKTVNIQAGQASTGPKAGCGCGR